MDDRRFDQLVKAVASGASRRSVLKGMLGLGGTALVGSAALETDVDAARRPTPTPKPVSCPGRQTWNGSQCVCPGDAPFKCGPDCCTGDHDDPPAPNHSECCDNACCFGTCYGEELCCPTNPRGQLPSLASFCLETNECCLAPDFCCNIDGCCSTVCWGGNFDDDFCCLEEAFCPGGGMSSDICCTNNTTCCGAGTDENECVDLSNGGCCAASDCGPVESGACGWECSDNQCESLFCGEGTICCQGECVSSSDFQACPADPSGCCDLETDVCCGEACCARNRCNAGQQCCGQSQFVCGMSCCENVPGAFCCGGNACCMDGKCAGGVTCCTGDDVACASQCCPPERCTAGVGCCPEGTLACSGGICCSTAVYQCSTTGPGCECLPGTEPCSQLPGGCCPEGQCNDDFICCDAGTTPCGAACCDNLTQTCNAQGVCECDPGLILCGGACIVAECCGSDTSACASLGYDPECMLCVNGECTDGGTEFLPCSTFDINQGWCNNGICVGCFFDGEGCDASSQCCSNNCVQGTCEVD